MRTIAFFLLLITFSSCSPSLEEKAKESIGVFLKEHMNDFKSYEPVKFGTLDTTFSEFSIPKDILDSLVRAEVDTMSNAISMRVLPKNSKDYIDAQRKTDSSVIIINRLSPIVEKSRSEFKPILTGFKMNHTLRGKNGFGAIMLYNRDFYFDKDLKVINMIDLEKEK